MEEHIMVSRSRPKNLRQFVATITTIAIYRSSGNPVWRPDRRTMTLSSMRAAAVSAVALWALIGTPASAEDQDFCAERPGQTTPPCTIEPGRFMLEVAAVSWNLTRDVGQRTDTVQLGGAVMRAGLTPRLEAQVGWTPITLQRVHDRSSGTIMRTSGTGDVSLGFLYGLAGANGPVGVQGFVTLPTGRSGIGAGDWGAGLRLPVAIKVGPSLQFSLTPEVDAAVNSSGKGRHFAFGAAGGIGFPLSKSLGLGADVAVFRDDDPGGAATRATSSLSLAWQVGGNTQLDIGGIVALNANSPDQTLYFGIAHRF